MSDTPNAPESPTPHGGGSHGPGAHEAHGHEAEHFHNHSGLYLGVGGILMVGTALTVYLAYVDFGSHELNITAGLLLATIKAILVALIFMHLKSERKSIYQILFVTMAFVIALFGLSLLGFFDHIRF